QRAYPSSQLRQQALEPWLHYYNHHRPHSALNGLPPAARVNNVLGSDT
ncbi:MAG TPA: integrase core domain-containing protein, partial [Thermoanaerobaculia bacterium]|nr:integrase core domain-containing protein [Thermoanaerobaculia bacterium]